MIHPHHTRHPAKRRAAGPGRLLVCLMPLILLVSLPVPAGAKEPVSSGPFQGQIVDKAGTGDLSGIRITGVHRLSDTDEKRVEAVTDAQGRFTLDIPERGITLEADSSTLPSGTGLEAACMKTILYGSSADIGLYRIADIRTSSDRGPVGFQVLAKDGTPLEASLTISYTQNPLMTKSFADLEKSPGVTMKGKASAGGVTRNFHYYCFLRSGNPQEKWTELLNNGYITPDRYSQYLGWQEQGRPAGGGSGSSGNTLGVYAASWPVLLAAGAVLLLLLLLLVKPGKKRAGKQERAAAKPADGTPPLSRFRWSQFPFMAFQKSRYTLSSQSTLYALTSVRIEQGRKKEEELFPEEDSSGDSPRKPS